MFNTINPVDNTIIETYNFFSKKEIDNILLKSSSSYKEWNNITLDTRIFFIEKLYSCMKKKIDILSTYITKEMGKPIIQSKYEVDKSIKLCKYYCDIKEDLFVQDINIKHDKKYTFQKKYYIKYEPIGCILGITPWNYPIWQIMRSSIPNLILGNVILIKPALNTIGCSLIIEKIFIESGFPKGVFQVLKVKNNMIEYIISNDIVQGVTFTGSTNTGSIIGSISGKYIKKSILELGGNDSFIVLKDVKNIDKVAKFAVESRLNNTGQTCISAKRFIVDKFVINEFIDLIIKEMKKFKEGDLYNDKTKIGYISRYDFSEKLYKQYKDIILNGAFVCLESKRNRNFFSPSLLKITKENMVQEELFGPIAILIPFYKEKEIPSIVNNTIYGLGASIWTNNIDKAKSISKNINTGMVFINDIVKSHPYLPFGGIKKSGYGRELSIHSIKEFSNWKTIVINNDLL
ncbi:aldehyde dehydrogenase family protein [Blattabacterium cuenoti]|uniref:aldehyde dehydrogenase family protein n=1 Tax=Blattabacterium cuenoti TaxID=1653831 RepID=UPI00163C3C2E|nr:aldehyde dehydrogenase family protein [Blattabacterium cuenoti]